MELKNISNNAAALNWVKDIFFPKFCVDCQKEGDWLCENCLQEVSSRPQPNLLLAGEGTGEPSPLRRGEGEVSSLDGVTALFSYEENTVAKLIKFFKYNYLMEVADIFKKIIGNFVIPAEAGIQTSGHWIPDQVRNDRWQDFVVIPVPLHPRRERERGFNQSEIIARIFAEKFGLEMNTDLRRGVYTVQQAKLSKEARQKNLKDAFVWPADAGAPPQKVLLVDDVFTTGATMRACARVLKNNGVKQVWGMVLARD